MGSYVWPCPQYSGISSRFGAARGSETHKGLDMACSSGKPIIAARGGTVTAATWHDSYGNYVKIDHGGGIETLYAHSSKLQTSTGKTVSAGEQIALVGTTGNSTGPHLHFEVRVNGTRVNPENYVSPTDTLANYTGNDGSSSSSSSDTSTTSTASTSQSISDIVVKSVSGSSGTYKFNAMRSAGTVLTSGIEIMIQGSTSNIYIPAIEGEVTLEYERKGSPGKLTFNVVNDGNISFFEGNPVSLRVDGTRIFYGYIFSKKRNKDGIITVTSYDQIRYLKNKDTMIYENMKYSELLERIASENNLTTGTIEDTEYVIGGRIEEGALLDILGNASDDTVLNTGKLFVLYDDNGALCLKNIQNMILPIMIDKDTAEDFSYTSSIDEQTYNRIKLALDNGNTGERELYIANDEATQASWGILQYYENVGSVGNSSSSSSGDSGSTGSRTTSQSGVELIMQFEGVRLVAYDDGGGTWTIGYGHTSGVYQGMVITQAQAEAFLKSDLEEYESVVNSKATVAITQNMFDALVSFSFNVGSGNFSGSTLLSLLNSGDYEGAAEQFGEWNKVGTQLWPGLSKRRAAEKELFLTGYQSGDDVAGLISETNSTSVIDTATLEAKAQALLDFYNKKTRQLQVTGCFGDIRVRGGSTLIVNLNIGDLDVQNYMVVESVKHKFENLNHTMDIKVVGIRGEFIA